MAMRLRRRIWLQKSRRLCTEGSFGGLAVGGFVCSVLGEESGKRKPRDKVMFWFVVYKAQALGQAQVSLTFTGASLSS